MSERVQARNVAMFLGQGQLIHAHDLLQVVTRHILAPIAVAGSEALQNRLDMVLQQQD